MPSLYDPARDPVISQVIAISGPLRVPWPVASKRRRGLSGSRVNPGPSVTVEGMRVSFVKESFPETPKKSRDVKTSKKAFGLGDDESAGRGQKNQQNEIRT